MQQPTRGPFGDYALQLTELLRAPHSEERADSLIAALDGEASRLLRRKVSVTARRDAGCFFTSRDLADRLLAGTDPADWGSIADPACGAGDLLLAAARELPLGRDVRATLKRWGQVLAGRELEEPLVRTARIRIALLASARLGSRATLEEPELAKLLPNVRSGDGLELQLDQPALVLLNPPYGMVNDRQPWGRGRLSRAGIFTAAIAEQLPAGSRLLAILPDVLRSGTNYQAWREHLARVVAVDGIELHGLFDAWTDVDVFLLRASAALDAGRTWPAGSKTGGEVLEASRRLGEVAEVRVGTVVPHRDEKKGPWSPYIEAHDLPLGGVFDADGAPRRRHQGRRFVPPFVAVRRTSRPGQGQPRALGVVIRASRPVLVENHLLVCAPREGTNLTCEDLIQVLSAPATSRWLDERIRCRHLTVGALNQVPVAGPP